MTMVATDFKMDEALKQLGIQDINNGTSTGQTNFGSGEIIESYSPVDGALDWQGQNNFSRKIMKK